MTTDNNVIDDKMAGLAERWEDVIDDPDIGLIRWMFPVEDLPLVDLFFRLQEEEYGNIPDLFFTFTEPLVDAQSYPRLLQAEFNQKYEELIPILKDEELAIDWKAPPRPQMDTDTQYFIHSLQSFQAYYKDIMRTFVVVLRPSQISDFAHWKTFVADVVRATPSPSVRFLVLEFEESPILEELGNTRSQMVKTEHLHLDQPGTMEALSEGDGADTPETNFRKLFVKLSNQASKGEIAKAKETADAAMVIATANNWLSMQVVICCSLGAGYMQDTDRKNALKSYKRATAIARKAKAQNDPAGPKMEIQCLFAEASVLFSQEKHTNAADTYMEAAPLADAIEEFLLSMEGWRMAAYCYEVREDYNKSIVYGEAALAEGEKLPEDEREKSTLPFVGQALIRVHDKEEQRKKKNMFGMHTQSARTYEDKTAVNTKMKELLGPEWEDLIDDALAEQGAAEQGAAAP